MRYEEKDLFTGIEGMDPVMIDGWDGITDCDITVGLIGGVII
jgi:hypothetical protein